MDHQRCALAPRCEGGPSGQSCPSARVVLGEGGPLGCLLPVLNCPQPTQLTVSQLGKGGTSSPEPQPTASSSQAIYNQNDKSYRTLNFVNFYENEVCAVSMFPMKLDCCDIFEF